MGTSAYSRVVARLRRLDALDVRIARSGFWLILFAVGAKVAGAAKEVAVAWRFGRGPEVDAYNLALSLSTWLPATLMSIMTVVLVPTLVRLRANGAEGRRRFLSELNGVAVVIGSALALFVWAVGPWSLHAFATAMPEETRRMATDMLRVLAPLSLVMVFVAVAASRLQAAHDHSYALADALPPLAMLLLILAWKVEGALPLVVGTLSGFALQAWWLERRARRRDGGSFAVAMPPRSDQWTAVRRGLLVMGSGQLLITFSGPVDQWFAASLGSGENATLGYANRILAMGMTVGATVISRATLPVFSEGLAGGQGWRIQQNALRWSLMMFGAGLAAAVLLIVAAPLLVGLLFERGAFSAADTRIVATALQWGAWQLPPYFGGLVLVALLASRGRYDLLTAAAALSLMAKLAGNFALAPALGVPGLLLATAAMYGLSALACLAAVMRTKGEG